MSIIEVLLLVIAGIAIALAVQAHKAHVTFAAQTSTDLASLKTDVTDLKGRLLVAEHKVDNPPAAAPAAPVVDPAAAA